MTDKVTLSPFSNLLLNQFKRKWNMLRESIDNCPDLKWHEGTDGWTYSYIIFHIIETASFYSKNNPDDMKWGDKAGIDWKRNTEEEIEDKKSKISKEFLLSYLQEIESKLSNIFSTTVDRDLLKKDDFHWFGSIYEKLVYLLRHNSYHLGELANLLREWNAERIKWQ